MAVSPQTPAGMSYSARVVVRPYPLKKTHPYINRTNPIELDGCSKKAMKLQVLSLNWTSWTLIMGYVIMSNFKKNPKA